MTMTRDEAAALRTARDTDATLLSRKPKHELAAIFRTETGTISPVSRYSKDELVGGILEERYPLARENEAIHVLHHDVTWPDCPHCQRRDDPPEDDPDGEAQRIAEVFDEARAELDRGL